MKTLAIIALALCATISIVESKLNCILKNPFTDNVKTMEDECAAIMKKQVNEELSAAMTYMAMGAHFSKDDVNLPGFAKFFFESASEERQHAIKIIEYLLMRLELTGDFSDLISEPKPEVVTWDNGLTALNSSLRLEMKVTGLIRDIIKKCEGQDNPHLSNDYHLVDYLSGDFLTEQYEGQRDLAGKISTLSKMLDSHGALGQFLFDKKLLLGEV